ncbi:unnamed protein product [Coregonus sp. 'balchen']|nr:unnamed protein product [Coregonus sp. 'balchen']
MNHLLDEFKGLYEERLRLLDFDTSFKPDLEQRRRVMEESVCSLHSENQDLKTDMDSLDLNPIDHISPWHQPSIE